MSQTSNLRYLASVLKHFGKLLTDAVCKLVNIRSLVGHQQNELRTVPHYN